ncbi:hypothetical protein [Colwellia sp. UCD-KL20]|uniref:hypothetical protein n=1 Tax=Colwellia sp. UCD-KL20 TaxID=1917165 RepID=UPI000970E0D8|nr:hypothetical protein [Colwellia sp. UCD-KL20]
MKTNDKVLFGVISFLLFVIIIILSIEIESIDFKNMILTFSSALLGVFLSFYLQNILNTSDSKNSESIAINLMKEYLKKINSYINEEEILISKQDEIRPILGKWHQYNLTKKNGYVFWIHSEYVINAAREGVIEFDVDYKNHSDEIKTYSYRGFVRDGRTVFVGKSKSNNSQNCFIELIPDLTNDTISTHVGICYAIDWDGKNTLIPVIFSRTKLFENEIDDKKLDDICKKCDILNATILFPDLMKTELK